MPWNVFFDWAPRELFSKDNPTFWSTRQAVALEFGNGMALRQALYLVRFTQTGNFGLFIFRGSCLSRALLIHEQWAGLAPPIVRKPVVLQVNRFAARQPGFCVRLLPDIRSPGVCLPSKPHKRLDRSGRDRKG